MYAYFIDEYDNNDTFDTITNNDINIDFQKLLLLFYIVEILKMCL